MFGRMHDWFVMNRGRFGEMSFSFAATYLWVMAILVVANVLYFSGIIGGGIGSYEAISILPWPLSDAFPGMTGQASDAGGLPVVFLVTCIFAPFVEEAFRAAVLQAICEDKKTGEMKNFFVILAMSVFFFGMIHGGYVNIFIQGALGLLLARLWFRVGRSQYWQYLSMVAVHAAYNFCDFGIQLMVLRALN